MELREKKAARRTQHLTALPDDPPAMLAVRDTYRARIAAIVRSVTT
jgi:hypothetical protein